MIFSIDALPWPTQRKTFAVTRLARGDLFSCLVYLFIYLFLVTGVKKVALRQVQNAIRSL